MYGGCISEGCRVLMFNGSMKNIEDLKKGDKVQLKNGSFGTI